MTLVTIRREKSLLKVDGGCGFDYSGAMKGRDILVAGLVALAAGGILELPGPDRLRDLSTDLLFALRHGVMEPRRCV